MRWRTAVDRAVAPLGLTHAQYVVLASLYGLVADGERPSQRQLADRTGLEAIYVSKLVRTLDRDGLVERSSNPADSRAVQLDLTARGQQVAGEAIAVVGRLLDELTATLGGTRSDATRTLAATLETLLTSPTPGGEP